MKSGLLELLNGSWSIILAWLIPFLMLHLIHVANLHKLSLRSWVFSMPEGMQLALAVLVAVIGTEITRVTVWYWRFTSHGEALFISGQTQALILGGLIGTIGFLCILRVASKPRFGNWPWVAALASALAYSAYMVLSGRINL